MLRRLDSERRAQAELQGRLDGCAKAISAKEEQLEQCRATLR